MAGKHTEPVDEKNDAFYLANLRVAAQLLNEANLIGVIEPINKYSVPGYYLNCFDKGKRKKIHLNCFLLHLIYSHSDN